MTIPTTGLDENAPAGGEDRALGDNRIREYKTQNREVLEVDHNYPSSGQDADAGKHKKVSLIEQADLGSGAEGLPILGAQTVSGKAELVFTDEDDNDVQLTSGGKLHSAVDGLSDGLKEAIFEFTYRIGHIYYSGVSTNPATLFGFGTWTPIEGFVIVGKAASGTFDTLDETMGAETHTLTEAEMPVHDHDLTANGGTAYGLKNDGTGRLEGSYASSYTIQPLSSANAGSGDAHNNIQPTIVKYVWQRTA